MQSSYPPRFPSISPQDFVSKWSKSKLRERAASQEHFIDICHLIGHLTPAEADPIGDAFTFDAGADKQSGGKGWADVWKRGFFAWEYKGKHKDLEDAYTQLLLYRESLLNPPLLIVSDMEQIVIHTNFTNTVKQIIPISLEQLLQTDMLTKLRMVFYEPETFRISQTPEQVTEEAAEEFAHLADILRQNGIEATRIAHFLIRLLFCLFAEDIGLLPKELFTQLAINTRRQPSVFTGQIRQLFGAMASGGWFGFNEIRHFDGQLFDDDDALELNSDALDILAKVGMLDWSNIEPSIFGTLFERSLDPDRRTQLGAHYTDKEDILLVVEPVLMTPLRRRWNQVQTEALAIAQERDLAETKQARTRHQKEIAYILTNFADEIAHVQILDPACGSGNFLYVALKQLLDLEKEVVNLASILGLTRFFPSVSPAQLYGMETNPYARELAQTTIWIGYIQWLRENGFGIPVEPILKPLNNIVLMDAILTYDEVGKPIEPEWPEADVIIGNPPFLGSRIMRPMLGDEYCDSLEELYRQRIGRPDLVCYWFEKARNLIEHSSVQRAGLLATQAIRGGTNRQVLDRIKDSGSIFMAWSDREWILEGATVHVSIIGFDNGTEHEVTLDGNPVPCINSDLTADIDLSLAQVLQENANLSFQGIVPRGSFSITSAQAYEMLAVGGNPNGHPNSDVIKPRLIGQDITDRPSNSYVIDFGINMSIEDASQYVVPFEYIREHVFPERQQATQQEAREKWWLHWRPRPAMRAALRPLQRYIATSRVSMHRLFVWVPADILPDTATVVIARSDDYFLGVLESKCHKLWARRKGTQLRDAVSASRYTSTTSFQTLPFPWSPGQEPIGDALYTAIAEAAKDLVAKRDKWLNPEDIQEEELGQRTLTNLYNEYPAWLALVHKKLDEAVFAAYEWPYDLSDVEILEHLLALNLKRADEQIQTA